MVWNTIFASKGGKFIYNHLLCFITNYYIYTMADDSAPTVDEFCSAVANISIHLLNLS